MEVLDDVQTSPVTVKKIYKKKVVNLTVIPAKIRVRGNIKLTKRAREVLNLSYEIDLWKDAKKAISATELRKVTGNESQHEYAMYFKSIFNRSGLYCATTGQAYQYSVIAHRRYRLEQEIGELQGFRKYAESLGKSFRRAPKRGSRTYTLTGDRYYAWFTLMKKEHRQRLFLQTHDVMYDYDIEAAKPTLTLQEFRKFMAETKPDVTVDLPYWQALVNDRTEFRATLVRDCGITKEAAKLICQSVLNSAWLTKHEENPIYALIGHEAALKLEKHELFIGLRRDYMTTWSHMSNDEEELRSGQFMSRLYNKLEKQVMDVVDELIQVPVWYVHDGFMTTKPVNLCDIENAVQEKTGLVVKFELNVIQPEDIRKQDVQT